MEASELVLIGARQNGIAVDFQLEADGIVHIDPAQIRQVIFSLMRNAMEAMAGAASRDLRVSTARSETDITVSIADTGPGVPLEIAARLFQPGVTSKPDRTGMDLAICHAIIKSHGGALWLDPDASRGATFHVKLPLAQDQ